MNHEPRSPNLRDGSSVVGVVVVVVEVGDVSVEAKSAVEGGEGGPFVVRREDGDDIERAGAP